MVQSSGFVLYEHKRPTGTFIMLLIVIFIIFQITVCFAVTKICLSIYDCCPQTKKSHTRLCSRTQSVDVPNSILHQKRMAHRSFLFLLVVISVRLVCCKTIQPKNLF